MNSFLKHSMQRQSFDAVPKLRLLENQSRLFPASVHRTLVATLAGAAIAIGSAHCGIGHNALGTFNGADETNTDLSLLTLLLAAPPASGSSRTTSTQIVAGRDLTCYLSSAGTVHCWGRSDQGQLGYGNTNDIGDDELPAAAGTVDVGGNVTQLTAGGFYACALLDTGSVRCWGYGIHGRLGYANTNNIGDDETPASAGDVNVGGIVTQISASNIHTCALLNTGSVRCWGYGDFGRLGYANTNNIGDDETPASAGDVDVGGTVIQIASGFHHTCALLDTGSVRCWGTGTNGQLGYGNTNHIDDDESPATAGDVNVGGTVTQITAGSNYTCALLNTGSVRCWGLGTFGRLGYANTNNIGDNEAPATAGNVNIGGLVTQISGRYTHTCALLDNGSVRCWGSGFVGALGYGNTNNIGDDEMPATAGDVNVGGPVTQVATGEHHNCVILSNGFVRCWGRSQFGQMGYGDTNIIGDNPGEMPPGDVQVFE